MTRRIEKILERWFILEPPLFQVLCLHELMPNDAIACPLRSGKRRLEYNPSILEKMSDAALEEAVKLEAVRLLLKHPYERFPDGCCMVAAALGSNVTVSDMLAVKAHVLNKNQLTGAAAEAADTNGDGFISITDFIQIKAHILGISSVTPM